MKRTFFLLFLFAALFSFEHLYAQCNIGATNIQPGNLILTRDTSICVGDSIIIHSNLSSLNYCWEENDKNIQPIGQSFKVKPDISTRYEVVSQEIGSNLVVNGNFENGNKDFLSAYTYNPVSGFDPAMYHVGSNLKAWHPAMPPCNDHTSGSGNMMLVNGAEQLNIRVWSQTISIKPNTEYVFYTWLQHITSVNPASLQFSINGIQIGKIFNALDKSCEWARFHATWNSGASTTATISILNMNSLYAGNDFALDDIFFGEVFWRKDSLNVEVKAKPGLTLSKDVAICYGDSAQLKVSSDNNALTYSWQPASLLSAPFSSNPVAKPTVTTRYTVEANDGGCLSNQSVTVFVNALPSVSISNDTVICKSSAIQLHAGGGASYKWTPSIHLSSDDIPNPLASPVESTTYSVKITDGNNCVQKDSVTIHFATAGNLQLKSDKQIVCAGDTITLTASGLEKYEWGSRDFLATPNSAVARAMPVATTTYTVIGKSELCNFTDSAFFTVDVKTSPTLVVEKSNNIDCFTAEAQLMVSGAESYQWGPAGSLSETNIANPLAAPREKTVYYVKGTISNGCAAVDSITVDVTTSGTSMVHVPTAFTPNDDGLNDCFGIKSSTQFTEFSLHVFNRWGEVVFATHDPNSCWNGQFRGVTQPNGVFVFLLKGRSNCGNLNKKGFVTLIH